jgi:hypothetical protein
LTPRPPNLAAMQPRPGIQRTFDPAWILAGWLLLMGVMSGRSASLQTFAVVFGQVTNDIAQIEQGFDDSTPQKETLAALVRARSVMLDPLLRDDEALAALVNLLGSSSAYETTLNESAANARAVVLSQYDAMGVRVDDLPPSPRTTVARTRFNELSAEANALAQAQQAAGVAALLAPFGRRLASIDKVVTRAQKMPRPAVGLNAVRARVNGRRFASAGAGRPTSNEFVVTAPSPLFLEVAVRVADGGQVIHFRLPVVTEDVSYEVEQGLATFRYIADIFASTEEVAATSGAFWVQRERNEIYGVFSVAGPGLDVKDGRFRVQLPRALRGD